MNEFWRIVEELNFQEMLIFFRIMVPDKRKVFYHIRDKNYKFWDNGREGVKISLF